MVKPGGKSEYELAQSVRKEMANKVARRCGGDEFGRRALAYKHNIERIKLPRNNKESSVPRSTINSKIHQSNFGIYPNYSSSY